MERQWKLGEDLLPSDNLLDGITFGDLILQIHCNLPANKRTPEAVRKELDETLSGRLEDMWYLLGRNMNKIIEFAR